MALALVAGASQAAHAAPPGEDEAEAAGGNSDAKKRFVEGNERYSRGDYDGAIEAFKAAIAADPKLPGPYRNLGLAYRAMNRCADALPMYEKYLELKPESRFTDRVRREIDLCRAKMGQAPAPRPVQTTPEHVTTGTPRAPEAQGILHVAANLIGGEATDEATVKVDGLVRGATPLTIPVTAGKHEVHLARAGFETAMAMVDVGPGERKDVELTMNKLAVDSRPAVLPVDAAAAAPARPRVSYRKYAWILVGVAGAAAAVGAGFGIAESSLHRDAVAADPKMTTRATVNSDRDLGGTYSAISYTGLGLGGAALLAAGIVFLVDGTRGETHEVQRYVVAPSVGRDGGGLVATVRF